MRFLPKAQDGAADRPSKDILHGAQLLGARAGLLPDTSCGQRISAGAPVPTPVEAVQENTLQRFVCILLGEPVCETPLTGKAQRAKTIGALSTTFVHCLHNRPSI